MRTLIALAALCIALHTNAQNTTEPVFIRQLTRSGFPYTTATIKIDGKEASYEDMLRVNDSAVLKVELYSKKAAVKTFGKEEGKKGVLLLTTRHPKPFGYAIITTPDSAKFYITGSDTIFTKASTNPLIAAGDTSNIGWTKFLQKNLRSDAPTNNGAPSGMYIVIVDFVVNADGTVSDVSVNENPGYGTGPEIKRLLSSSPVWQPALYNGKPVKFFQKQAITFLVEEM